MLVELDVANFAIIEALRVSFGPGLNVLTGETGAGKSILIDAVNALLGGRCGAEVVRGGAEVARVEGIFSLSQGAQSADGESSLSALLGQHGLDGDDGGLILSREIHRNGRSVARLNGRAVPLALLQQIGRALVDIHGQGEHLSLLRVGQHIHFLDHFAGLVERRREYARALAQWREVRRAIDALQKDEREQARKMDLLRFQVEEIRSADLRIGEDVELRDELNLLNNAAQRSEAGDAAHRAIASSSGEASLIDLLGEAIRQMAQLAKLDPAVAPQLQALEDVSYQVDDLARFLRNYRDSVEFNPARLTAIEERLELIRRLRRKYGNTIADILSFGSQAEAELSAIAHGEERLDELKEREFSLAETVGELAKSLSAARRAAAESLGLAVERELGELNMGRTRFVVACVKAAVASDGLPVDGERFVFDETGVDRVEFLVAANPGEPLRPLVKVASGGETARLMLALKTILARADAVPTLIFDEIDVGIGGRSGQVVGMKLWRLSAGHQVLCVTHLPQIACYADDHFQIAKQSSADRATTSVTLLSSDERVVELATMLGGESGSAAAEQNAGDLLARAGRFKLEARSVVEWPPNRLPGKPDPVRVVV